MSLTVNGILIPESEANALTVNGVDITSVFLNGIEVFHQLLFRGVWSGNSFASENLGYETSGNALRCSNGGNKSSWLYMYTDGTLSSSTITVAMYAYSIGLNSSGNTMRAMHKPSDRGFVYGGYSYFSLATGWSGNSFASVTNNSLYYHKWETSGGSVRYIYTYGGNANYGGFINVI